MWHHDFNLFFLSLPQATLMSTIFKHELALGHSQAAYNAMLANPDASRYNVLALHYFALLTMGFHPVHVLPGLDCFWNSLGPTVLRETLLQ